MREALRKSLAEYEQFRLHLPEAFIEVSFPSFHVSYMNQVARSIFGYSEEEVSAGIHGYTLLDERSLVEVMDVATKHMASSAWIGKPYEREPGQRIFHLTLIRRDGSRFPADVQGSYILDEADTPIGVRYIFRDTTTRQVAELERARLAAIVESSDDSIVSRSLDGTVLSWNGAAERMYGYTAAEMIGSTLDRLELPEFREQLSRAMKKQEAGEATTLEIKRRAKDGHILDISLSLFPVRDSRGEVVAVGNIARDVGERIRSLEESRRSSELIGALSSAQSLFIRERDPRPVFEGLLPSLLRLTESGYGFIGQVFQRDGQPYLKTHALSDISWDDFSRGLYQKHLQGGLEFTNLRSLFGHVLTTGERVIANDPRNDLRRGGQPDRHPPLESFMGLPIRVGEQVIGMVGIANRPGGYDDAIAEFLQPFLMTCGAILESLNIEAARRAAEDRLDRAMRGAELALWEWDIPNNALLAQFAPGGSHGFGPEVRDMDLPWLMERVHPEDREKLIDAFRGHAEGRYPLVECEHRVLNGVGKYRWMLTRGMVVSRAPDGRPLRAAGTFLDITERKLAEDERQRLEQQVRQSQKLESLGVFAGGIAHDFNNLLTAILGNLYLLGQRVDGAEKELTAEARQAAERGADLVRRLLTYARPEVERRETIDLDRMITETASLARSALTPRVHLKISKASGPATVRGSWTSLQQVLINLMVNARDAMPDGGTLTISRRLVTVGPRHRWAPPELPRGRYHVIAISDTGAGMPPELVARIFDPFFTTKDIGRGSGLGLSTALGIARAHGGWLAVESAEGAGSTFRLLLPAL